MPVGSSVCFLSLSSTPYCPFPFTKRPLSSSTQSLSYPLNSLLSPLSTWLNSVPPLLLLGIRLIWTVRWSTYPWNATIFSTPISMTICFIVGVLYFRVITWAGSVPERVQLFFCLSVSPLSAATVPSVRSQISCFSIAIHSHISNDSFSQAIHTDDYIIIIKLMNRSLKVIPKFPLAKLEHLSPQNIFMSQFIHFTNLNSVP